MQKTVLLCETILRNGPATSVNSLRNAEKPEGTFCGAAVDDSIVSKRNSLIRCPKNRNYTTNCCYNTIFTYKLAVLLCGPLVQCL